jgi:hypothetical protein
VHRAIEHGIHEIYTLSNQNNPALTGGVWNGGYFIDRPPLVAYIRYIPVLVYRHFNKREFNFWKSESNYYDGSPRTRMRRLQESRGYTVAVKLPGILAERVQFFTHPLWLFLLIPFIALTGEYFITAIASSHASIAFAPSAPKRRERRLTMACDTLARPWTPPPQWQSPYRLN